MKRLALILVFPAIFFAACGSTSPETEDESRALDAECNAAITSFKNADPDMRRWFDSAYGYAIFPSVGKGGAGIGGAYGRGQVYEQGKVIGYSSLKQATIGLQLGGQSYREVIFFKNKSALDDFRSGNYELGAQASAVAATAGASADADYSGGVAIFTLIEGGLMAEVSVGGQKFDFVPK